jgi:hypothetical protein
LPRRTTTTTRLGRPGNTLLSLCYNWRCINLTCFNLQAHVDHVRFLANNPIHSLHRLYQFSYYSTKFNQFKANLVDKKVELEFQQLKTISL